MSHNYPYNRSVADFSSHQGAFSTPNNLHHEERVYQTSLQPSPHSTSIFTAPKSALDSYSSQSSTTTASALSLLSSCGLEPADLSILAGMPENMITEETLPHLLMELRQKKALRDRPSSPRHSTCHQPLQPPGIWENSPCFSPTEYHTNPPKHPAYPPNHPQRPSYPPNPPQRPSYPPIPPVRSSYPPPREETGTWKDRWGNPRQTGGVRQEKASSSYVVDYNYGRPQEGVSQSLDRPAYHARAVGIGEQRPHSQSSSDYRQLNPGKEPAPLFSKKQILPLATTVHSTPTAREANDFHGAMPQTFPYACSLCDIAVLSQKDWTSHTNGAQHADSQLAILQLYPDWDCRTGSARRDSNIEKGREEKNSGGRRHGAPQHYGVPSSYGGKSYPAGDKDGGRVVCAKYPANSMDDHSLRRLVGQVGTAVNVMMFPVQAFIEMSSSDEAEAVVKYFDRNPIVVKGSRILFSMSATYNFLQNSPVVMFSSLPPGNVKYPEIMAIAKRFGPVKHSLFLPNRVLVEMGSREDAGKLVQYYTTNPLKMTGKIIQVSHSTEHSTLKFAVTGKKADDGEASTHTGQSYRSQTSPRRRSSSPRKRYPSPRRRSPSPRRRSPIPRRRSPSPRRRSDSPRRRSPNTRRRSSSQKGRSPSPRRRSPIQRKRDVAPKVEDKASLERTQEAVVKGNGVLTETADLGSSQELSCTHTQTKESVPSPKEHPIDDGTGQKTQDQTEKDGEGGTDSDMDSDIEGMAVIGEDEEMRSEDGSMEFLEEMEEHECDEAGTERTSAEDIPTCPSDVGEAREEEEKQVEAQGEVLDVHLDKETGSQSPTADPAMSKPPSVMAVQVEKQERQDEVEEPNEAFDEDEPDFPESLENCITLDELEDDDNEGQKLTSEGSCDPRSREEEQESGRVLYIQNLPSGYYTDKQFVAIGQKYGKVNRYFLIRRRQEGFIEMEKSADAQSAQRELSEKGVTMDRNILVVHLSRKYKRLTCGWKPEPDSEDECEQRKCQKEKRREEQENRSSRTKSRMEEEPPAKKICIREGKATPAEPSSSIKEEEMAATEEPSSNMEQQQPEEEEKGAIDKPSSSREQQQAGEEETAAIDKPSSSREEQQSVEAEKGATEEPSSSREQQQQQLEETEKAAIDKPSSSREEQQSVEAEKGATEEPSSSREQQQQLEETEKAAIGKPSSSREQQEPEEAEKGATEEPNSNWVQPKEEEKGSSEMPCEQEELAAKTEKEDVAISQPSDSVDTQKTEGETNTENPGGIRQVNVEEEKVEMITEPTRVPLGPYLPNNPMGREFISQKIGYFCSLCNAIYVTEDEARNEHCSTLSHYEKLTAYLEQNCNHN